MILVVVITIILAAVITALAFGVAESVKQTNIVVAIATQHGSTISVTYYGAQDNENVIAMSANINGTIKNFASPPKVGDIISDDTAGHITSGQDHIVVVATFKNNSHREILDTYV